MPRKQILPTLLRRNACIAHTHTRAGEMFLAELRTRFPDAAAQREVWALLAELAPVLAAALTAPVVDEATLESRRAEVRRQGDAALAALVALLDPEPDLAAWLGVGDV
jgi:hypothetical protein